MDLSDYNECKNHYCLAHLCHPDKNKNHQSYIDFFKNRRAYGDFITLDNGAAEGALVTQEFLLKLVDEIKPTEVIAPDVLYNGFETMEATTEFAAHMYDEHSDIKIMGVPQGHNVAEWMASYLDMLQFEDISVIGLSKLSIPKAFCKVTDSNSISVNRRYVVRLLNELGLLTKPIHLLGMRNITEFNAYKGIKNIRSTDSCWTILAAMKGIEFDWSKTFDDVNDTPEDYFNHKLTDSEVALAKHNINEMVTVIDRC